MLKIAIRFVPKFIALRRVHVNDLFRPFVDVSVHLPVLVSRFPRFIFFAMFLPLQIHEPQRRANHISFSTKQRKVALMLRRPKGENPTC
jgi:hypothetical protein